MPSEWRIDVAIAEQEHFDKYGWLPGDEWHEDSYDALDPSSNSWVGDRSSWDYPDPLVQ